MRISGDFDFLARCVPSGGLIYNRQVLSKIRFHPQQLSKDGRRHNAYLDEMHSILQTLVDQMDERHRVIVKGRFPWTYGHQFFNLAVKRFLNGDKSFLDQFIAKSGSQAVVGSAFAWLCKTPKRVLQKL